MFLNVILTILVITLISVVTILILWWKKYGKKVFESLNTMLSTGNKNISNLGNVTDVIGELKKSMQMLNNLKNGGNKNGK